MVIFLKFTILLFRLRKKGPFKQLFSIHAYIRKDDLIKQVPLFFILMSRRTATDYRRVFKELRTIVGAMQVSEVVSDFEREIWRMFYR